MAGYLSQLFCCLCIKKQVRGKPRKPNPAVRKKVAMPFCQSAKPCGLLRRRRIQVGFLGPCGHLQLIENEEEGCFL